jgi:pilus assembly protein CpaB
MARLRGFVWLSAGIVLALLAGLVAYTTLTRVTETPTGAAAAGPTVTVMTAARSLPIRSVLTISDLIEVEMPAEALPEGAIRTSDAAVGRLTTTALFPGEPVLEQKLVDPNVVSPDGRKALFLLEDEVLMALPTQDMLSRSGMLSPGDHVDILFSLTFPENRGIGAVDSQGEEQQATFGLLQNVTIAALLGGVPAAASSAEEGGESSGESTVTTIPDGVLVSIAPQDALAVKYAMDAGGVIDLVLRAPGVEKPFVTDPVDIDYLINRYRIPTGPGR